MPAEKKNAMRRGAFRAYNNSILSFFHLAPHSLPLPPPPSPPSSHIPLDLVSSNMSLTGVINQSFDGCTSVAQFSPDYLALYGVYHASNGNCYPLDSDGTVSLLAAKGRSSLTKLCVLDYTGPILRVLWFV